MGWWLFAMPRPFVRPGHPHPGPLPLLLGVLGERGFPFLLSRPSLGSRFRGMGLSGGLRVGKSLFLRRTLRFLRDARAVLLLGVLGERGVCSNGPYGYPLPLPLFRLCPLTPALFPQAALCTTRIDGYCWRLSSRDPPLSFGHFPRERGNPDVLQRSPSGRGEYVRGGWRGGWGRRGFGAVMFFVKSPSGPSSPASPAHIASLVRAPLR